MRTRNILALGALVLATAVNAEVDLAGSAAINATKKSSVATSGNIDEVFVRGEVKASVKAGEKAGGMVHLRYQQGMKTGSLKQYLRQAYFTLPVSILTIQGGRWYEKYTPGYYFGRFLYGVKNNEGSGSMNTNYNIVDGLRLKAAIVKDGKLDLHLAALPVDMSIEKMNLMVRLSTAPVKGLVFNVAGNFGVVTPEDVDGTHALSISGGYEVIEDLKPYVELAWTDLSEASDNMWVLLGLAIPTGKVLDGFRAEFEIKSDRVILDEDENVVDHDGKGNLAWMVMAKKKVKGLTFDLNVGADPQQLGSESAGDIGVIFRTTVGIK